MIPSEKKELALYRLVKRSGGDDWWPTSIANLGNGVGSSDWKESVNVLKRLHHAGHIALRKHNGQKFEDYSPAETADVSFFYHGHFQILMTPSGLPYFERLEEIAKLEQVDSHPKSAAAHAQASPTLKWEKEVLEKIEALQNLMLGSVTGGERDEGEYRRIRDELFRMPGLKEALPRFVRTCGDLSQFWHFIKTQGNLGSYASRREYIWNAFRPLLAGVDDEAGIEREVFFAKGSDHDAYVHIRAILQAAKTNLFIIDPYMDGSIYQVLGTLAPATMTGRILTSKCPRLHDGSPYNKGLSRPVHHS